MNEHDSLASHALNNMTLNELANTYADLFLDLRRERERKDAAIRALAKISNYLYGINDGGLSPQQIALDALRAEKEAYGYREEI